MEIDLTKAEEYYSNLPDSELKDYFNKRAELNPSVVILIKEILAVRGIETDEVEINAPVPDQLKRADMFSFKLIAGMMALLLFHNIMIKNVGYYDEGFVSVVWVIAETIIMIAIPSVICLMIVSFGKKPVDLSEVLFWGTLVALIKPLLTIINYLQLV